MKKLCFLCLFAIVLLLEASGVSLAIDRDIPLEVFEAECSKAKAKFLREAKNACIRKGKVLEGQKIKSCDAAENPDQPYYPFKAWGTFSCNLRL
jgi:hypothetical protein